VRTGPVRVLNDISNSLEYGYAKPVNGVAVLDIAAAVSAVGRLATIVADCIRADGSAVFQVPLPVDEAKAAWRRAASDVGGGRCAIVADGTGAPGRGARGAGDSGVAARQGRAQILAAL
jgi:hypothetical protein